MSRTALRSALAAAVLAAAAGTTACSDTPTAPASTRPEGLGIGIGPQATREAPAAQRAPIANPTPSATYGLDVSARVANSSGELLPGASVTFIELGTQISRSVTDGASGDLDARPGHVKARLWLGGTTGTIRATVWGAPFPYSTRGAVRELPFLSQGTDFGTFTLLRMPFVDATFTDSADGRRLAGGALSVRDAATNLLLAGVADNAAGDRDPSVGRIRAYFDSDKPIKVHETSIPVGYQSGFPNPIGVRIVYDGGYSWTWKHSPFVYK
jgi:hypothetical protein